MIAVKEATTNIGAVSWLVLTGGPGDAQLNNKIQSSKSHSGGEKKKCIMTVCVPSEKEMRRENPCFHDS